MGSAIQRLTCALRASAARHFRRVSLGEVSVGETEAGDHPGAPERHGVDDGKARGEGHHLADRRDCLLDVAAAGTGERPHALPGPCGVDTTADCGHRSGHLAAGDVALPEAVRGEGTASDHHVDAAHADRLGGDQHLSRSGNRTRDVHDGEPLGIPELLDRYCPHGGPSQRARAGQAFPDRSDANRLSAPAGLK